MGCAGGLEWQPRFRPCGDRIDHAGQRAPLLGDVILDADRRVGEHRPLHDAFRFEFLQPLRKHPVAEARHGLRKVAEARDAAQHGADDGAGPAAADQLHGVVVTRAEAAGGRGVHVHRAIITQSKPLDKCKLTGL